MESCALPEGEAIVEAFGECGDRGFFELIEEYQGLVVFAGEEAEGAEFAGNCAATAAPGEEKGEEVGEHV